MSDFKGDKILVHVDPELRELVPGYLENRRKDVDFFREALEMADFESIRAKGHDLKGSGGGYGFNGVTEIGGWIEKAAKEKNSRAIREQINNLSAYLGKITIVYSD
ncbi:Hpt domain-containing protein [Thermodesulfobacteriota bacterium]